MAAPARFTSGCGAGRRGSGKEGASEMTDWLPYRRALGDACVDYLLGAIGEAPTLVVMNCLRDECAQAAERLESARAEGDATRTRRIGHKLYGLFRQYRIEAGEADLRSLSELPDGDWRTAALAAQRICEALHRELPA